MASIYWVFLTWPGLCLITLYQPFSRKTEESVPLRCKVAYRRSCSIVQGQARCASPWPSARIYVPSAYLGAPLPSSLAESPGPPFHLFFQFSKKSRWGSQFPLGAWVFGPYRVPSQLLDGGVAKVLHRCLVDPSGLGQWHYSCSIYKCGTEAAV